jgi:hypothetical protein
VLEFIFPKRWKKLGMKAVHPILWLIYYNSCHRSVYRSCGFLADPEVRVQTEPFSSDDLSSLKS